MKAINKNPAMMEFLDTVRNDEDDPQRELRPRAAGALHARRQGLAPATPNYTQDDIVQIARAFTGWRLRRHGQRRSSTTTTTTSTADFPERGPKVIYKSTGGFGAARRATSPTNGEGAAEIDTRHRHHLRAHATPTGKNTVARRIARRLLEYFAHAEPVARAFVDEVVAASGFATHLGHRARCCTRSSCTTTSTRPPAPAPYAADGKKSVKWPIDYVVSTLRLLADEAEGQVLPVLAAAATAAILRPPDQHGPDARSIRRASSAGTGRAAGSAARRCWRATTSPAT